MIFIKNHINDEKISPLTAKKYSNAIIELKNNFNHLPDESSDLSISKDEAWDYLYYSFKVADVKIQEESCQAIKYVFQDIKNKQKAWNDVCHLLPGKNGYHEHLIYDLFTELFPFMPEKQDAWHEFYTMIKKELSNGYYSDMLLDNIFQTIRSLYLQIPDRQEAWDQLFDLILHMTGGNVWRHMTEVLHELLPHTPDKQKAWRDLCALIPKIYGQPGYHYREIERVPRIIFDTAKYVQDKKIVWEELYQLYKNDNPNVRLVGRNLIFANFCFIRNEEDIKTIGLYNNQIMS